MSKKFPYGICRKGVNVNSICCTFCKKWIHRRCSGVVENLEKLVGFKCRNCSRGDMNVVDGAKQFEVGTSDELEVVEKFCYLGDVIGKRGGAEESSRVRVRCAWGKFMDFKMLLTARGASLRVKGKIYRACVQRVLVYGSETWAMKVVDMQRLLRTENNIWLGGCLE